ncbi:hypothetical protein HYQ46_007757 [Verticillium longisporum]|nr:hypothetical protein HYQ46_007757 [Verticillium longisporum]
MAHRSLILLSFGHVARSPRRHTRIIKSLVGLLRRPGSSFMLISGRILMSPEYFWLRTLRSLVARLGKKPISARN